MSGLGFPYKRFSSPPSASVLFGIFWLVFFFLYSTPLMGQTPRVITHIEIEGTTQVEQGQILTLITSSVGSPLDVTRVTSDIQNIFALGFFQEVRAFLDERPGKKLALIFRVLEKPRIAQLKIVGQTRLDEEKLFEDLPLKAGDFYSQTGIKALENKIRSMYREKGYFTVKIRPMINRRTPTEYDLTIVVEEKPRLFITSIQTKGNKIFSELEIRRMMKSEEVDCFEWLYDSGIFDENKINADLGLIASKYISEGYVRVFIEKPKVRVVHTRDYSRIHVELTFQEGPQFHVKKTDVQGELLGDKNELMDILSLKPGKPYNPYTQNRDRFSLAEIYQAQGYAFVQVIPEVKIDEKNKEVAITYRIIKGDKAYIGRIEFEGNRETRDYVLRREMEVREHELYNGRNLRVSQENLRRLGYFKPSLALSQTPTDVGNQLDITGKVEETQTGTLQAQIGFSDQSGFLFSLSVSKGNLFGRGQTLRLSASAGQRDVTESFSFDFIEPHFLDSDVSSDSSLSRKTFDDVSERNRGSIIEKKISQGFGMPLLPRLKMGMNLSYTKREYGGPRTDPVNLRGLSTSLTWNSVNHPVYPSSGTKVTATAGQIGGRVLGGDTDYRRYRTMFQQFHSLNEASTVVFMAKFRMGWLEQVGDNPIPLEDRYRIGGMGSVRGFDYSEIGGPYGTRMRKLNSQKVQAYDIWGEPIVDSSGNPTEVDLDMRTVGLGKEYLDQLKGGGIQERVLNLEILFPLTDQVRGVFFYDAGNVNSEPEQYAILGETEPKFLDVLQSAGFGIRMITPMGVFRFEYGHKLNPDPSESKDKFDFTISSLF